jgi:hypothetical protein
MTRKTYVMRDGQLVEKHLAAPLHEVNAPMVMGDLQPYQSMVTGEMVTSRSRHRQILREHRLVEVGNETGYLKSKPITTPPGLKETLIREVKKHRGY